MNSAHNEADATARVPIAAVTGGRRGIGRAIAYALADSGFDVIVVDLELDDDAAETLGAIRSRGRRANFISADLALVERREALARDIFATFGTLDCLVNNAGVVPSVRRLDLLDVTPESFDRVMGINLRGTFFLTQAIARRMVAEPPAERPLRSIITITSGVVGRPRTDWPEYAFSKTGLSLMSQAFALRLASHGVRTYEIRPGVNRTSMSRDVWDSYEMLIEEGRLPLGRIGLPEDIARAAATLAAGQLSYTTGDRIYIDGGVHIPVSQTPKPRVSA